MVLVPEFSILALEVCLLRAVFRWKFQIISICDDSMDMIRGNELSRLHALARKMAMPMIDDVILPDSEACRWYREHYGKGIFFPIVRDEQAFRMQCREALPVSLSLQKNTHCAAKRWSCMWGVWLRRRIWNAWSERPRVCRRIPFL